MEKLTKTEKKEENRLTIARFLGTREFTKKEEIAAWKALKGSDKDESVKQRDQVTTV